jgi:hypothetical protein
VADVQGSKHQTSNAEDPTPKSEGKKNRERSSEPAELSTINSQLAARIRLTSNGVSGGIAA